MLWKLNPGPSAGAGSVLNPSAISAASSLLFVFGPLNLARISHQNMGGRLLTGERATQQWPTLKRRNSDRG